MSYLNNKNVIDNERECAPLFDAIKNARFRPAFLLVQSGANVNEVDSHGRTPLTMTSIYLKGRDNWQHREKFGNLLLDHKADPNMSDHYGLTPLMHAVINGQSDYVALMLAKGKCNYEARDKVGNNIIMLAAHYGQVEVLRELKDYLIQINASERVLDEKNNYGKTAIELANDIDMHECVALIQSLRCALNGNQKDMNRGEKKRSNLMAHKSNHTTNQRVSHRKSSQTQCQLKLPPINGDRLVSYSDWANVANEKLAIGLAKLNRTR